MQRVPLCRVAISLLVFFGFLPSRSTVASCQAFSDQNSGPNIRAVRTIVPEDFRESLKDRLSGGLDHQVSYRMTMDSQQRILVTEPFLSLVQVFDTKQGKRWQIRGDRNQRMIFPTYIAVDGEDNIYISDSVLAAVMVFQPDGHFLRTIGGGHPDLPFGIVVDQSNHMLYVADYCRDEIQVYTLDGQLQQIIAKRGTEPGDLNGPVDLVLHHGVIFVLDAGNARFQIFDLKGNSKGILPFGNDRLPVAFALDAAGNLYCVDLYSLGMLVLDPAGKPLTALDIKVPYGQPGRGATPPSFTSLSEDPSGSVLALRPGLTIDVVKLETNGPHQ